MTLMTLRKADRETGRVVNSKLFRLGPARFAAGALVFPLLASSSLIEASTRPKIPANFTQATVKQLLDDIEHPHAPTVLKVGYFGRRVYSLPVAEGWALLREESEREPVASRRWFLLQNVRAAAAFNVDVDGVSAKEGLLIYNALFDQVNRKNAVALADTIYSSVEEFVNVVPNRLKTLRVHDSQLARQTLSKAWTTYLLVLSEQHKQGKVSSGYSPQWAEAVEASRAGKLFLPLVTQAVQDPQVPKNYWLLKAAAELAGTTDLEKAEALLMQAKALLPEKNKREAVWLYGTLVDLAEKAGRWPQAASLQKEKVALTGRGQAELLRLYAVAGEDADLRRLLQSLQAPTADEGEVLAASRFISQLVLKDKKKYATLQDVPVQLLKAYLAAARTRDPEAELRARVLLAREHIARRAWEEALNVLAVEHIKAESPATQYLKDQALYMAQDVKQRRMPGASE